MQKLWIVTIIAILAFGCAATKKTADISIGTWDYTIKGVPDGNATGNFIISKAGDNYAGSIQSSQGSTPFETITVEDGQLNCTFSYQSYKVVMKGTFDGETFSGNATADGNYFPMTATKRE